MNTRSTSCGEIEVMMHGWVGGWVVRGKLLLLLGMSGACLPQERA